MYNFCQLKADYDGLKIEFLVAIRSYLGYKWTQRIRFSNVAREFSPR